MSKLIPLGSRKHPGYFAIVDEEDFESLICHRWTISHIERGIKFAYACRRAGKSLVMMHREILKAKKGELVDHKNHNTLDNRRSNLRLCDKIDNGRNSAKRSSTSSAYKGVRKIGKKYEAYIKFGSFIHLGMYPSENEAAQAYNDAAAFLFGEFAFPNIISVSA